MPKYAYSGSFDTFPALRESLEQAGAVVVSIATVDNVVQVETETATDHADLTPLLEE